MTIRRASADQAEDDAPPGTCLWRCGGGRRKKPQRVMASSMSKPLIVAVTNGKRRTCVRMVVIFAIFAALFLGGYFIYGIYYGPPRSVRAAMAANQPQRSLSPLMSKSTQADLVNYFAKRAGWTEEYDQVSVSEWFTDLPHRTFDLFESWWYGNQGIHPNDFHKSNFCKRYPDMCAGATAEQIEIIQQQRQQMNGQVSPPGLPPQQGGGGSFNAVSPSFAGGQNMASPANRQAYIEALRSMYEKK